MRETLSVPPLLQDVTERERTASWMTQLFLQITVFNQASRLDLSPFSVCPAATDAQPVERDVTAEREPVLLGLHEKQAERDHFFTFTREVLTFTHRPETKLIHFWTWWKACLLSLGGNNDSQSGFNFFYDAFFCEGHFKDRAAAAISAAPAPADLLLRSLRCAVTARSLPKQAVQLTFASLLHAGWKRQSQPHQLLPVGERGEDVVPQHFECSGPAGGVRHVGGSVRLRGAETPCGTPAGNRAGEPGKQWVNFNRECIRAKRGRRGFAVNINGRKISHDHINKNKECKLIIYTDSSNQSSRRWFQKRNKNGNYFFQEKRRR